MLAGNIDALKRRAAILQDGHKLRHAVRVSRGFQNGFDAVLGFENLSRLIPRRALERLDRSGFPLAKMCIRDRSMTFPRRS